ncbi:rod-binding protein [Methylocystis parvus]|uniref:Flagellar protein FlgJ N-terminal domain-containing protein n=1 Tax=Methylocystis parvus TaxID=134 RepID=A0A6B8M6A9_9HYPH|nr:rod-binding protein [Methylocystis parvus]QGM97998.1 hypothetical protein F7D14_11270 [Methylocystis parvus]WBK01686.1 rod-binding protein [Methylocystis parvus OBBP]
MSIFPATDLISDVARAANPTKAHLALERLERASAMRADLARHRFDSASLTATGVTTFQHSSSSATAPKGDATAPTAARKFEAFLLQSWLEMLLPKEETGVFGSGAASGVWRSLMAERLGEQLAQAGGIGVQKLLLQSAPPEG